MWEYLKLQPFTLNHSLIGKPNNLNTQRLTIISFRWISGFEQTVQKCIYIPSVVFYFLFFYFYKTLLFFFLNWIMVKSLRDQTKPIWSCLNTPQEENSLDPHAQSHYKLRAGIVFFDGWKYRKTVTSLSSVYLVFQLCWMY